MKLGNKSKSPTNDNKHRGSAMLLVVMMSTFTMGIWMVTFRSTRDAIQTESFHASAPYFEGRIMKALAHAGNMLKYQDLKSSRYEFLYVSSDARGRFYTTVELRKGGNGRIEAAAHPASDHEVRRLPRNPSSF